MHFYMKYAVWIYNNITLKKSDIHIPFGFWNKETTIFGEVMLVYHLNGLKPVTWTSSVGRLKFRRRAIRYHCPTIKARGNVSVFREKKVKWEGHRNKKIISHDSLQMMVSSLQKQRTGQWRDKIYRTSGRGHISLFSKPRQSCQSFNIHCRSENKRYCPLCC